MTERALNCWKCGAALADIPLPLGRMTQCKVCHAYLHVCRMCVFFDRSVSKQCREPIAEEVQDKTRTNFCGYLQPSPNAFAAADTGQARKTQTELDALFGLNPDNTDHAPGDADEAQRKLDQLFGLDKH